MTRYIVRRVLAMVPLLLFATAIAFVLGQYGSGDLAMYLTMQEGGGQINLDRYYEIREILGLDDPVFVRYGRWLWNALHGDLGTSWVSIGMPAVKDMIVIAIPISLQLGLASLLVLVVTAVPLGILAAVTHNSVLDHLIVGGATIISSIPGFVRAPLAMIFLVAKWKIFPYVGLGWHGLFSLYTILPALTLASGPVLGLIRYTRSSVLEVLSQEYVRAARAKGLPELTVIAKHVVKNAMTPVLTVLGMTAAYLMAGSIFIEVVFNLRGFGSLAAGAIRNGDLDTSTGVLLVSATLIMTANLLVDLTYGLLDPRVRLAK